MCGLLVWRGLCVVRLVCDITGLVSHVCGVTGVVRHVCGVTSWCGKVCVWCYCIVW